MSLASILSIERKTWEKRKSEAINNDDAQRLDFDQIANKIYTLCWQPTLRPDAIFHGAQSIVGRTWDDDGIGTELLKANLRC